MRVASTIPVVLASMIVLGCTSGGDGVPVAEDATFEWWDGEQTHARVPIEGGLDGVAERLEFERCCPRNCRTGWSCAPCSRSG
ncbi:MAG: hypothetical protein R3C39_11540 [Dehalococcoidia bacterium]